MTKTIEPEDGSNPQQALQSAEKSFAEGNLGEAAAMCLKILDGAPADPITLHLLGLIRHREGNSKEAIELLQKAVGEAPDFAFAHNHLGEILMLKGRKEVALESFRKAVALRPDLSVAHANLGNALHSIGRLEEAEESYRTAIRLGPNNIAALVSMGNLSCQNRKPDEALELFTAALALDPDSATLHQYLGKAYAQSDRLDDAQASFGKAVELEPMHADANFELGMTARHLRRFDEALKHFEIADNERSRPMVLECLLKLKRHDEFFDTLKKHESIDRANLRTAAISAYASEQLGRDDLHPFCPDPIGHIRVVNDLVGAEGTDQFLEDILAEVRALPSVYEPRGVTTQGGYQTGGNLFANPPPALAKLLGIFKKQVVSYYEDIADEQSVFVQERPKDLNFHGWYVRYLSTGYQGGHIHPFGWLTCVIYLSMPKNPTDPSEGGIKFTLKDEDFPEIREDVPELFHVPVNGQIVLFPSTLYHYTIPVTSGEERLMIASDVLPDAAA